MVLELAPGDILTLRKPHPCGGCDWKVIRLGTDIGLECLTCRRNVLLHRSVLEKRVKRITPGAADTHSK